MKKLRMKIEPLFHDDVYQEEIEIDDDCSNEEIEEIAMDILDRKVAYGWDVIDDEENS